tara:strand:- start:1632 stop:1811 length:180 start_codon:yes stop_codon:yes gene_type:complete
MDRVKAKLKYLANTFEVIEKGDYVECAVSKKKNSTRKFKLLECRASRGIFFSIRSKKKV